MVSFWISDEDFCVQVSLALTDNGWQLDVTVENSRLDYVDKVQRERQMRAFIGACVALYDMCYPNSIKMYWDDDVILYSRQLSLISLIKNSIDEVHLQPLPFEGLYLQWRAVVSLHDNTLFLVDPFPLWLGKKWQYVSII